MLIRPVKGIVKAPVEGVLPRSSGGGFTPMDQVVASALADGDVTLEDSYAGTGTNITNLTAAGTAYDMTFGSGLAFTGDAGSPDAYLLDDGSADAEVSFTSGDTTFLKDMYKTAGSDFWVAIPFYFPTTGSAHAIWGNQASNVSLGMRCTINSGALALAQRGSTGATSSGSTTATVNSDAYNLVIVSHSHSTNTTSFWINGDAREDKSHTLNGTVTDPSSVFKFMEGSTFLMPNGARKKAGSLGNEYLNDTKAAAIKAEYESRYNLSF